jgi:hypothetical protein
MSKLHKWNVVCVKKFTYPMPNPTEFQVKSKTLLGASMKASNKLKTMEPDWIIKSVYWLDPKSYEEKETK